MHGPADDARLPDGVLVRRLLVHPDSRGNLAEMFREEWPGGIDAVQWNVVRSAPGVLRGVHVHPRHDDYLVVIEGHASIGLRDLRRDSPTANLATLVELSGDDPAAITIPAGVAHGFYFRSPSLHVYATTHYWDPADELGCHWADPELGVDWPAAQAIISERDERLPSLRDLVDQLVPAPLDREAVGPVA